MATKTKNTKNNEAIKPNLGMSDEKRAGVTDLLQKLLADEMVIYTRLRNYHWNVTGPQFQSLHEMFEDQYTTLADSIDVTAERIRSYGVNAIGTMKEFIDHSRLSEIPGEYPHARQMVINLVEDHEAIIRHLREDIETAGEEYNDVGAEDYLTGALQDHQEMAWMLRTFVDGPAVHE